MVLEFDFDYCNRKENNEVSQAILEANKDKINASCRKVLELLKQGHHLTVRSAMIDHNISSLPRRVKDLKDRGIEVKDRLIDGRYKEYFL